MKAMCSLSSSIKALHLSMFNFQNKRTDFIHLCALKVDFIFLMKTVLVDVTGHTGGCPSSHRGGPRWTDSCHSNYLCLKSTGRSNQRKQSKSVFIDKREVREHARV